MKNKALLGYIPFWPKGCSIELLALKAGYIPKGCSRKRFEQGMKRIKTDLAWITVKNEGIVERMLPTQKSTRLAVKEYTDDAYLSENTVYVSKGKV